MGSGVGHTRRFRWAGLFSVALVLGSAGCSAQPAADFAAAGPWAAEFQQEYERTESDYVKAILEDGKIDELEVRDARQQMITCMTDRGYESSFLPDAWGGYYERLGGSHSEGVDFTPAELDAAEAASWECRQEWIGFVDDLQHVIINNPNNEPWSDLVVTCLLRHGLVREGFTGHDYDELTGLESTAESLPGGRSLNDPDVLACRISPAL